MVSRGERGRCGFGSTQNTANDYVIVEPNTAASVCAGGGIGAEPYISCTFDPADNDPNFPAPRAQAMGLMAAGPGSCLYLISGMVAENPAFVGNQDFWQYCFDTHAWRRLTDPPFVHEYAVLTYDSDQFALVVRTRDGSGANDKIFAYDLISQTWADKTPAGLPCNFNTTGAYLSGFGHFYEGGVDCLTQNAIHLLQKVTTGTITPTATWFARPYSAMPSNAPVKGIGGAAPQGKHLNIHESLANGKVYFNGGDYGASPGGLSEYLIWRFDILNDTWVTDKTPTCGNQGEIIAGGSNEVGWVWDLNRQLFWYCQDFTFSTRAALGRAAGAVSQGSLGMSQRRWFLAATLPIQQSTAVRGHSAINRG